MFKLDLEKTEKSEIKLPTSVESLKKQESSRKTFTSAVLTMPKPLIVSITTNRATFLKRWEYQTTWPASWENLYGGQEATVRAGHGAADWLQTGKGVCQGCILSPCLLNLYVEYIMRNAELDEVQVGIKISGRNINNLGYADDTAVMAESEEELKSFLMKVKGEWKSWLKAQHSENKDHGIWSIHFMGNRWGNSGNSVRLYFWGALKSLQMVTAAMKLKDACSLEGKLWPT